MSEPEIQRVLVDFQNKDTINKIADCDYQTTDLILSNAGNYIVNVEAAEVDLSLMKLDLDADYHLVIDYLDKNTPLANLTYGFNHFRLQGMLDSAQQFVEWLNNIFTKVPQPYYLGLWGITDLSNGKPKLFVNLPADHAADYDGRFVIYLNHNLAQILSEYTQNEPVNIMGEELYPIYTLNAGRTTQERYTLNRLAKFKSVRFFTNLPVRQYKTYNQNLKMMRDEPILTTIILNTAEYDIVNQTNLIYVPNIFRDIELVGNSNIASFSVMIRIYYQNGQYFTHTLAPGEYFNLQLAFKKIS